MEGEAASIRYEHLPARLPGLPRVRGTNRREIGASAARECGPAIRLALRLTSLLARRNPSLLGPALAGARSISREDLAELEGLAGAISVCAEDLACARSLARSMLTPHCTNFGAVPPATPEGGTMISWNFDVPPPFRLMMGRMPLFSRELEGTIPYVCFGFPALFSIGILNAEGLCCVVNAVGVTDDGPGHTQFELNNTAMETCSTVDQAEEVFASGPRQAVKAILMGMLLNWNTIWADRSGGLAVFENSHSYFHRQAAGESALVASTNHHQFLDRSLTGSADPIEEPVIAGSYSRLARIRSLLEQNRGRIDPVAAKAMTSDHVPDYTLLREFGIDREWWQEPVDDATVCAHAWNLRRHLLRGELEDAAVEYMVSNTVYSLQVMPDLMTVWFTDGKPCSNPATPIYWGDTLGSPVERVRAALDSRVTPGVTIQSRRRGIFRSGMGAVEGALDRLWMSMTVASERAAFKHRGRQY